MKAFLSIKYYDDMRNKDLIEKICCAVNEIEVFAFVRDVQNYGKCNLLPHEIMERAFKEIKSSDILIVEASELSIGVGIEAGYGYSNGIPIYLIANHKAEVSNSIKGIAYKTLFYKDINEISSLFR